MGRQAICPFCKQPVSKDYPTKKYQNKTYHLDCYKKLCAALYSQQDIQDTAVNMGETQEKKTPQQSLYDRVCEIFGLPELNGMLVSQIKKFTTEYKYSYSDIEMTVDYYFTILKNTPDLQYGIGIVPFVKSDAKEFYKKKKLLEKSAKKPSATKIINIRHTEKTDKKNPFEIDINTL